MVRPIRHQTIRQQSRSSTDRHQWGSCPSLAVSHLTDDIACELRAFYFCGALHESRKIVSHTFGADRAIEPADDHVGNLSPAEVSKHHLPAQHHAARIYLILICIFGRRPVGSFENRMTSHIINVPARSNPDP